MIERECPICGAIYHANPGRLKWGRQTTCSRACSYRLRAGKLARSAFFACATCGREIKRTAGNVTGKYGSVFCSRACHYAGRATGATRRVVIRPYNISDAARAAYRAAAIKTALKRHARDNYKKSEATRAKLSIATSRALARGQPFSVSKLEDESRC